MKKLMAMILVLSCVFGLFACGKETPKRVRTIEGNVRTYGQMNDGTWECDGYAYKYRLEIDGTLTGTVVGSTFVYLSNTENIQFEEAWMISALSSNIDDYFAVEDAVLVDWSLNRK